MGTRENKIEDRLRLGVKALGGVCAKWISPGFSGVPDRIVQIKGHTIFVETKTPDGDLSQAQIRAHRLLRSAGASVSCVTCQYEVDSFLWWLDQLPTAVLVPEWETQA